MQNTILRSRFSLVVPVALLCAGAFADTATGPATITGADLKWQLPEYATLEGDILTVDVPEEAARQGCCVRADVDLASFDNRPLEATIVAYGERIGVPRHPWNGLKFQFDYKDADSGETRYPNTGSRRGNFPRQTLTVRDPNCSNRIGAHLVLGLQDTSGKVVFDLSTLTIQAGRLHWPVTNQDLRCEYTERVTGAPVRRGVMSPSRDMVEDDFRTLQSWGATLLRYQMVRRGLKAGEERNLVAFDTWLEGRLEHFDKVVLPLANQYGIQVVLDLHFAPGGRGEGAETWMLHNAACARHFVETWRRIAERFKGRDGIYGYDLVNEPVQTREALPDGDWWSLQRRAAEAIREIDPETPILIETQLLDHPEAFTTLSPLALKNIIYEVHVYNPAEFTHQGVGGPVPAKTYPDEKRGWDKEFLRRVVTPVRRFEEKHGAKIYVGEFSAIAWAPGADVYIRDATEIFNEYGWDWTYHAFREWTGWSVEHEGPDSKNMSPSEDNPRKQALLDGMRKQ